MAPRHSPRRSHDQHQAAVEAAAASASSHSEDKLVWLHGDLDITIHEARRLPNMDMVTEHLRRCFAACRPPISAIADAARCGSGERPSHRGTPKIITSDPYVTVSLAGAVIARTRVIPNAQDPVYDEHFRVPVAHRVHRVEFHVKDDDIFGAQHIGTATVSAARLAAGEEVSKEWLQVLGANGKPPKPETALLVSLQFTPVDKDAVNVNGIAGNPQKTGVPQTYFPLRKGGMVTLYQDAHIKEGDLPTIELDHGNVYVPARCWEDICHAILGAHHLVYIVGWSIFTRVRLVRESELELPRHVHTLGDLLRYKTQEGVRVCMLVWDDKTSHDKLFIKTGGVMATHDEETRKFFKHSSVICVLSPRYASSKLSYFKQQVVGTLYTHHQKCVIVDSQAEGNYRKITSFIGGLDLCDGRYDTPQHRLFSDLETIYKDDFHNPTFATATKGPRQPWHDLHCKIEGPAAYDVLTNFEQRWKKATKWRRFGRRFQKASQWRDDALLKLERISWILSPSTSLSPDDHRLWVTKEEDPQTWHVQVFRSIDSGSVKGFPKDVHEAEKLNLACGKNLVVDKSIHTAYVKAIRSAQHFIYIENQYFLGSSYGWPSYKNAGAADNLIPMELALKIASKIRARERFAVYIVIPMWPEGVPSAASVQEILFWQGQTMQMMYEIVAQELKSMNYENALPQDYLNFYCLGNREELPHSDSKIDEQSLDKGAAGLAQKHRRFMIYVHAKGMIVDDEYVILGSANINQRSLSGSRDTEIAMGAYQPHYTFAERKKHPHGQIYGYRMSLWAEHLGEIHDIFEDPSSLECVQHVNNRAELNWRNYAADELTPLKGHLLKYPVNVDADGKVEPLPEHEHFPDVGGKVLGAPTSLPDTLTM